MPSQLAICDTGLNLLCNQIRLFLNVGTCRVRLFVNDHIPAHSDTNATYTEASFPGYAPVPLTAWSAGLVVNSLWGIHHPQVLFTLSTSGGPYLVYGYYVTAAPARLLWAQRDPAAPISLANAGDTYPITPVFTGLSQF